MVNVNARDAYSDAVTPYAATVNVYVPAEATVPLNTPANDNVSPLGNVPVRTAYVPASVALRTTVYATAWVPLNEAGVFHAGVMLIAAGVMVLI